MSGNGNWIYCNVTLHTILVGGYLEHDTKTQRSLHCTLELAAITLQELERHPRRSRMQFTTSLTFCSIAFREAAYIDATSFRKIKHHAE